MSDQTRSKFIFEEAPIPKAVMTLAIPTIITQLINIIYNYADTWYVGRTENAAMVAALSVSFPIFVILAAIANLFGIGGSSVISRSLGMKKPKRARSVFAFCFYGGLFTAVIYALIMILFRPQIIMAIGGDSESYAYVYDYIFWTMILGAIPTVGNVLCGHLVRSIGAAKEAAFGMSLGGILNIILDPLFMFVLLPAGHEVTGAAIATFLSNCTALLYFIVFLIQHKDNPVFSMNPHDISLRDHIPQDVFAIGLPAALQTTLSMVSNIFANVLVSGYGNGAVAGMGVAKKINMIAFNTCMGLTQGVLPLLGYTYGAKNYGRMKKAIAFSGSVVFLFGCICTLMFRTFSSSLVRFFINEPESVKYGTIFLDIIAVAAPLAALTYMTNTVFQASGHKGKSFLLSILRKGVADVPAMFLLKDLIGIEGVVIATPLAEIFSAVLALILFAVFMKSLQNPSKKSVTA